jgi:hypothetical protein
MKDYDPEVYYVKRYYYPNRPGSKWPNCKNTVTCLAKIHPKKGKNLFSKRFGYFSSYTDKQRREELRCPSGYTVGQAFSVLKKLWIGYKYAIDTRHQNIKDAEKYAREIQKTQDDLGIDIASFPNLGIFGDKFVLYDRKSKIPCTVCVDEDHSHLRATQQMHEVKQGVEEEEEIEILVDSMPSMDKHEIPKEKVEALVPLILEPDEDKNEELEIIADEYKQEEKEKVELDRCELCGGLLKYDADGNHRCKLAKDEKIEVLDDDIPFRS